MIIFFYIIPLIFIVGAALHLNYRNKKATSNEFYILTVYNVLLASLFIIILFLSGFLTTFLQFSIIFVLVLALMTGIRILEKFEIGNWDLQLENIKNIIIFFGKTVFTFYVFMVILRFMNPFLQIPLAIIITAFIYFISLKIQKRLPSSQSIKITLTLPGNMRNFVIFIFGLLMVYWTFNLPMTKIGNFLNTTNGIAYMEFDGIPTDTNNDFFAEEVVQLDIEFHINSDVLDYAYDEDYVYIFTRQDGGFKLMVLDIETGDEVFSDYHAFDSQYLSTVADLDTVGDYKFFYNSGDDILFLGINGLYTVEGDQVTLVEHLTVFDSKIYYEDSKTRFLVNTDWRTYEIHEFNDGLNTVIDTIDINIEDYDHLTIISKTLFYTKDDVWYLYSNPSVSFDEVGNGFFFDPETDTMYTSKPKDQTNLTRASHTFSKLEVDGSVQKIELYRTHNENGMIIGDKIVYTNLGDTEYYKVEFIDDDFEFYGYYKHHRIRSFFIMNELKKSYIVDYKNNDENLEYMQVDANSKHTLITIYRINEKEAPMHLAFYSHYGTLSLVWVIALIFIPITNNNKGITYVDFDSAMKTNGSYERKEDKDDDSFSEVLSNKREDEEDGEFDYIKKVFKKK